MKLYFLANAIFNKEVIYEKGKTYEVTDEGGFSYRWIRRGVAIPAKDLVDADKQLNQVKEDVELAKQPEQDLKEASNKARGNSRNSSRNKTRESKEDLL